MTELLVPEIQTITPRTTDEIIGSILESKYAETDRKKIRSEITLFRSRLISAIAKEAQRSGVDSNIAEMTLKIENNFWNDSVNSLISAPEAPNDFEALVGRYANVQFRGKNVGIKGYIYASIKDYNNTSQLKISEEIRDSLRSEESAVPMPKQELVLTENSPVSPNSGSEEIIIPTTSDDGTAVDNSLSDTPLPVPPDITQADESTSLPETPAELEAAHILPNLPTDKPTELSDLDDTVIPPPPTFPVQPTELEDTVILPNPPTRMPEQADDELEDTAILPHPAIAPLEKRDDLEESLIHPIISTPPPEEERLEDLADEVPAEVIAEIIADDIPEPFEEPTDSPAVQEIPEIVEALPKSDQEDVNWANNIFDRIKSKLPSGQRLAQIGIVAGLLIALVSSMNFFPKPMTPDSLSKDAEKPVARQEVEPQIRNFFELEPIPFSLKQQIEHDLGYIAHQKRELSVDADDIAEIPDFIYPGSELSLRDILFAIDHLGKRKLRGVELAGDTSSKMQEYRGTVDLLLSAKVQHPEAVKFVLRENFGRYHMDTVDWHEQVEVKATEHTDFVVIGGELESIAAALRAVHDGKTAVLCYAGPLCGLSSKFGGNMRFFDFVPEVGMSETQKEIMQVLEMTGNRAWSIPPDAGLRLRHYIETKYEGQIKLVQTASYNSMHLNYDENGTIENVLTQEGVQINGNYFVDAEPSAIIAEKAGLDMDIETPNIGYGLIFDVKGINQEILEKMRTARNLQPDRILAMAGLSKESITSNPTLHLRYLTLQKVLHRSTAAPNEHMSWGYEALGNAFDLYMHCLEAVEKDPAKKAALHRINGMRVMSGFNVSAIGDEATFNSISYQGFPKAIKQHDHSLRTDPEFRDIREIDMPALEEFLARIAGKELDVYMPDQLYVRQASAAFVTNEQYHDSDFQIHNPPGSGRLKMSYPIDLRAAVPRDEFDNTIYEVEELKSEIGTNSPIWRIRPETSTTRVPNLGIVSPAIAPPKYVGALRIIQNLIGTSEGLVDLYNLKDTEKKRQLVADASRAIAGQIDLSQAPKKNNGKT